MPGATPGARPLPPGAGAYAPRLDPPAQVPPQVPHAGTAYVPPPPVNGLAVTSLVLGILGLCTWGMTGLLALVFGAVALRQITQHPPQGGQALAVAGIILGSISVGMGFLFLSLFNGWFQ